MVSTTVISLFYFSLFSDCLSCLFLICLSVSELFSSVLSQCVLQAVCFCFCVCFFFLCSPCPFLSVFLLCSSMFSLSVSVCLLCLSVFFLPVFCLSVFSLPVCCVSGCFLRLFPSACLSSFFLSVCLFCLSVFLLSVFRVSSHSVSSAYLFVLLSDSCVSLFLFVWRSVRLEFCQLIM